MHRMRIGGRAGVRSGMPCFPGQCLIHRGCCRVKTSCQRSLREEIERRAFDLGKQSPGHSHTPPAPSPKPCPLTCFLRRSPFLHGPPRGPASCSTSSRRGCVIGRATATKPWAESAIPVEAPCKFKDEDRAPGSPQTPLRALEPRGQPTKGSEVGRARQPRSGSPSE